uniref:Uncharacterized protein n=1 Tax=Aegilops tauschii subsp. strangulata TaxID=200361 RepID=A0A453MLF6_AEGTS
LLSAHHTGPACSRQSEARAAERTPIISSPFPSAPPVTAATLTARDMPAGRKRPAPSPFAGFSPFARSLLFSPASGFSRLPLTNAAKPHQGKLLNPFPGIP